MPRWLALAAIAVALLAIGLLVLTRTSQVADRATPATSPTRVHTAGEPRAGSIDAAPPATPALAAAEPADAAVAADAGSPARAERVEILADVRESGPARGAWTAPALALLRAIPATRASDVACYAAGCTAVVEFRSEAELGETIAAWQDSPAYAAWTGGARLSAPEVGDDGAVVIGVVLYPPAEPSR